MAALNGLKAVASTKSTASFYFTWTYPLIKYLISKCFSLSQTPYSPVYGYSSAVVIPCLLTYTIPSLLYPPSHPSLS